MLLLKHSFSGVIRPVFVIFDFFFFNYALLFVSLGSIITHFIHLLPTHSSSHAVSQGIPVLPPQALLFLNGCLSDNPALKGRAGKGGKLVSGSRPHLLSSTSTDNQTVMLDVLRPPAKGLALPLSLLTWL